MLEIENRNAPDSGGCFPANHCSPGASSEGLSVKEELLNIREAIVFFGSNPLGFSQRCMPPVPSIMDIACWSDQGDHNLRNTQ